jgi:uncharacterized protein
MVDYIRRSTEHASSATYDRDLREYMIKVFNYMCGALVVTGLVSFLVLSTSIKDIFFVQTASGGGLSTLGTIFTFAPLVFVLFFAYKIQTMRAETAKLMLWIYSTLMGISLSPIFLLYTGESIARVFFISASVFASMSIYGYTTKRDLTNFGSFLIMGLIGVLIASIVNMFMQSSAINFITSILMVLIFTGLTAYDVQKIKHIYDVTPKGEVQEKAAVMGALSLYLDFINLFLSLLRLFGNRRG